MRPHRLGHTRTALIAVATAICGVALALPGGGAAQQGQVSARTVKVKDDYYSPKSLSVSRGTTVKWVWANTSTANRHDVVVKSGPEKFKSAKKRSGSYSHKMSRSGTYKIYCTIHPTNMKMTLSVR